MTTAETGARLGISDARVRRLILDGRLKAIRAGARVLLIRPADLKDLKRNKAGRPKK